MGNPAGSLFLDPAAGLPAGWAFVRPVDDTTSTGVVEGADGLGCLVIRTDPSVYIFAYGAHLEVPCIRSPVVQGDFDLIVVCEPRDDNSNNPLIVVQARAAGNKDVYGALVLYGPSNVGAWYPYFNTGLSGVYTYSLRDNLRFQPSTQKYADGAQIVRLTRYGGVFKLYMLSSGYLSGAVANHHMAWTEIAPHPAIAAFFAAWNDDVVIEIGSYFWTGLFNAVIPMPLDGVVVDPPDYPAPAAAPAGAAAVSAALADSSSLGTRAQWDPMPAAVARVLEVQSALDAGFSVATLQRRFLDHLQAGEVPSLGRKAAAAGETHFWRARYMDETNQPGAWSAVVSATAVVYPSLTPSFTYPVPFRPLPGRSFVVREDLLGPVHLFEGADQDVKFVALAAWDFGAYLEAKVVCDGLGISKSNAVPAQAQNADGGASLLVHIKAADLAGKRHGRHKARMLVRDGAGWHDVSGEGLFVLS